MKKQFMKKILFLVLILLSLSVYSANIPLYVGESYTIQTPTPVAGGYICNVICTEKTNNLIVVKNDDYSITVIAGAYISSTSIVKLKFYEMYWGEYSKRKEIIDHNEKTYTFTTQYPNIVIPSGENNVTLELGETKQLKYKMTPSDLLTPPMNFGYNMLDLPCVHLSEDNNGYVTGTSVGKCRIMAVPYNNSKMSLQWTITVVDSNPNKIKLMADPTCGEVEAGTYVSLRTPNVSGTEKYYTLDGTTPTKNSLKYDSGIPINNSCTLKAIAYKDGYITSDILTTSYTVQQEKLTLNAETTEEKISAGTVIKLIPSVSGANIYYTLDGSKPTQSSTLYTSAGITIDESCTLKAIAYKDGYNPSDVLTKTYIVELTKIQLTSSLSGGEVIAGSNIFLTTPNAEGASIYYTLDGSSPTTGSTLYTSSGISIEKDCTLKAIAVKEGYKESDILVANYSLKIPVTSISLSDSLLTLGKDGGEYVYATILPDNTICTDFTWKSSNPDVATVSEKGTRMDDGTYRNYVSAKALGTTTITCTANDGSGIQGVCIVNVYPHGDKTSFIAKTVEGVEIYYYVESAASGTCEVNYPSNKSVSGTITIPRIVDGLLVNAIRNNAFYNCKYITQVNLPSSIEKIGDWAFQNCTWLSSMALDYVKHLGKGVFVGCSSLTKITGINNLEYIGYNAFHSNTNGDNAIPWYNKLPDGILYLGKVLYKYKGKLPENTEISVKEGIVSISPYAFYDGGSNLESIILPKSLSNVSVGSFYICNRLKKIVVTEGNETYDSRENCNAVIEKNSNTLIIGCVGSTIPNSIDSIGDEAFYRSNITSVLLGSRVRKIGKDVFSGCSYLDTISVSKANPYFDSRENCNAIIESKTNRLVVGCHNTKIPRTVKTIGSYAFYTSTSKLASINIHDEVEAIEDYAFYDQWALKSVTIGRGIKRIGECAFANCYNLKCVHSLSELPTAFDETAFRGSWNSGKQKYDFSKATLYVPHGTTINYMTTEGWLYFEKILEIDDDAPIDGERFTHKTIEGVELTYEVKTVFPKTCELVESPTTIKGKITIPEKPRGYSVVSIGQNAFNGYDTEREITEVIIPEGVTSIGYDAFYYIKTLNTANIPNTVKSIGGWAFYGCGLTSLVIPNSVDSIASGAYGYNSLESIAIGKGVRKLVNNPFQSNGKLKSITVDTGNPYLDSRDNCNAVIEKSTNKLVVGCPTTKIPSTVKTIGTYAFSSSSGSTVYTRTIPDNVETIEPYAFGYNSDLRSLTIGKKVKEISKNAFYGCYNLKSIHVLNSTPLDIDESVFGYYDSRKDTIYNNAILYVPIGAKSRYMYKAVWSKFKRIVETDGLTPCEGDIIEPAEGPLIFAVTSTSDKTCEVIGMKSSAEGRISIPSQTNGFSVKGLGYDAFYNKKGITHIDIPTSVTYLDDYSLYNCSDLESLELPSSLESIGYFALGGLGKINSIVIPKTVKDIDRGIFTADSLLMSVTVESGNPVYNSRGGCNAVIETATNTLVAGIQSTVIPNDIKSIGCYAFNSQKKMETMLIPNGVACIDEYAFNNSGLKSITIPAFVDSIGSWAFRYCRNLNAVISLIENPTAINENVFYSDYVNSEWQFTSATLYVPKGCKEKYQNTGGWGKFKNIVEFDPKEDNSIEVNIHGIAEEGDKQAPIYNLSGQRLEKARKGVNIVGGKKVLVK